MNAKVVPLARPRHRLRTEGEPTFTPAEIREVLALAIADAMRQREPAFCQACPDSADGACGPHAADIARSEDYRAVALQLGIRTADGDEDEDPDLAPLIPLLRRPGGAK